MLIELATINHHFFKDKKEYLDNIKDGRSTPRFSSIGDKSYKLAAKDSILYYLKMSEWQGAIHQTYGTKDANFWCRYNFSYKNKLNFSLNMPVINSTFRKIYYADGKTEDREYVLSGKSWYNQRQIVDSCIVDINIIYPIETETVTLPLVKSEKIETKSGDYVRIVNIDDRYFQMEVPRNLYDNIAAIHCLNKDGIRKEINVSGFRPFYSDSMYSYASKCYSIYSKLIDNMDSRKYKGISELKADYEKHRIPQPRIREIYESTYLLPQGATTIEYTYYQKFDSLQIQNIMSRLSSSRKSNYIPVSEMDGETMKTGIVDLSGNWIIKPEYFFLLENELGVFFSGMVDENDSLDDSVLYKLNVESKSLDKVGYTIKSKIENRFLIVLQDNKFGVVDKNGKIIVPLRFDEVIYTKDKTFQAIDEEWDYYWYDQNGIVIDTL